MSANRYASATGRAARAAAPARRAVGIGTIGSIGPRLAAVVKCEGSRCTCGVSVQCAMEPMSAPCDQGHLDAAGYTRRVPHKDPHAVLGVEPGSSPDAIKAAWRSLARRHHPDLTADDPGAVQRATRRMAEINTAYAALTRAGETREGGPSPRAPAGLSLIHIS